ETSGEHSNVTHLALDAFLDMPTAKGNAINAYASMTNFNYGENYVSRWAGTGTALYSQVGYFVKKAKIMPYIAYNLGNYEGYDHNITATDIGINYFINGHNCKLTLEYHKIKGDIREGAIATPDDALTQIRMQLHVFL
ncbi:MAG: hypothetical protein AAGJ18_04720, partial [Bacteroidota bacterium]